MNLETKITIYKFTPQLFTLTLFSPWVWVPFPRNCPEGAGFYLELEKGLKRLYFIISL